MIETDTSIDRLTVIAFDTGGFETYLKESGYVSFKGLSNNYGFRYKYQGLQGELIEVGDKGKVRIDFNPNKANMEQIEDILSRLKYPHLTRMDIAIDYFGIDLSQIDWEGKKRRKEHEYRGLDKKRETLYIGVSDKIYRIYNKLRERLDKGEERDPRAVNGHWRVEVQKRYKESDNLLEAKEYFLHDLFDIRAYRKKLDLSYIEKASDRLMIRGLLECPEEMNELSNNTRAKYKKLIQEAKEKSGKALEKEIEIEPHEVYEKEKDHLIGQLDDLLKKCFVGIALK